MRFVPTVLHGVIDYAVGLIVVALPLFFGWSGTLRWTFIAAGAAVLVYSAMTDYECGLVRFLRVRFHLFLDAIFGIGMLAAPSFLAIPQNQRMPVYVIGVAALVLVFITKVRAEGTHSNGRVRP